MKNRVTMQDIAEAVGVSNASVSRAFRGDPKCSAALREKILSKAEEMGYRLDAMQSLHMTRIRRQSNSSKWSGMVIAILACCTPERWGPKRRLVLQGAAERAAQFGVKTEVIDLVKEPMSIERLRSVLLARGIRGLIISPMPEPDSRLELDFSGFAAVSLSSNLTYPGLHRINHSQYASLWEGLQHLYDKGYRRIGLAVADHDEDRYLRRRQGAFLAFCRKYPDVAPISLFTKPRRTSTMAEKEALRCDLLDWVERERPQVVIGLTTLIPEMLKAEGYRIPEDIAFFDCSSPGTETQDGYCGIRPPWKEIGEAAVDMIYGQWARFEYGVPKHPMQLGLKGTIFGI